MGERREARGGTGGEIGPGHIRDHLVLETGSARPPRGRRAGARDLAPDPGRCPEISPREAVRGGGGRRNGPRPGGGRPLGRFRGARAPHTRTRARDGGPRGKDRTRGGKPRAPKGGASSFHARRGSKPPARAGRFTREGNSGEGNSVRNRPDRKQAVLSGETAVRRAARRRPARSIRTASRRSRPGTPGRGPRARGRACRNPARS